MVHSPASAAGWSPAASSPEQRAASSRSAGTPRRHPIPAQTILGTSFRAGSGVSRMVSWTWAASCPAGTTPERHSPATGHWD